MPQPILGDKRSFGFVFLQNAYNNKYDSGKWLANLGDKQILKHYTMPFPVEGTLLDCKGTGCIPRTKCTSSANLQICSAHEHLILHVLMVFSPTNRLVHGPRVTWHDCAPFRILYSLYTFPSLPAGVHRTFPCL